MAFQKFHNKLKVVVLSCVIATSFVLGAAAQSPKDMIRIVAVNQILADRTPVRALSKDQLLQQRKKLARFVRRQKGPAQLLTDAATRLRIVEVELRNRKTARPGKPKISQPPGGKQNSGRQNQAAVRAVTNARPSASLSPQQLQQRIRTFRDIIVGRKVRPALLAKARTIRNRDLAELRKRSGVIASSKLFAVLKDRRPSASLPTPKLRQRIRQLAQIIGVTANQPKRRSRARNMHAADIKELKNRSRVVQKPQNASALNQILTDTRLSPTLSKGQLRRRIALLERLLEKQPMSNRNRKILKTVHTRDVAELSRRRAGGAGGQPPQNASGLNQILTDRRLSPTLSRGQLRRRIALLERLLEKQPMSNRNRKILKTVHTRDVAELNRRRAGGAGGQPPQNVSGLNQILTDRRLSPTLSRGQLRRRIALLERLLEKQPMSNRNRKILKTVHSRDVAELNRRRASGLQPGTGRFAVLEDRRPATGLNSIELRGRVAKLRNILRNRAIVGPTRRQLSQKLIADRTELRRRVAERRARNAGERFQPVVPGRPVPKLSDQARRLLSDTRPSNALSKRQLNIRIRAGRNVLKFVALTKRQRFSLNNMIKLDRAEKRRRLLAARERRRAKLDRLRLRGELRIEINPGFAPQPYGNGERRRDLAAAEADEGQIQRQFLEPAPQNFERRYSREEIVRRPDLTRGFAGIDVDTVNFGFNEYWIREEEVDELERMAVTIERILAARPYEVFQIEGHTDAVGSDAYNLKLSRQRAEAVRDALTKFFVIPSRALVTVGLGERYLKIPTLDAESENRRVTIRRITPIVRR